MDDQNPDQEYDDDCFVLNNLGESSTDKKENEIVENYV